MNNEVHVDSALTTHISGVLEKTNGESFIIPHAIKPTGTKLQHIIAVIQKLLA